MYKLLLFLNKTNEEDIINHFKETTLQYLSAATGQDIKTGEVESGLLLEQKYRLFCEVTVNSKDEWNAKIATKAGKEFVKDLSDFHRHITPIFINY
jgi:hypothetical protein